MSQKRLAPQQQCLPWNGVYFVWCTERVLLLFMVWVVLREREGERAVGGADRFAWALSRVTYDAAVFYIVDKHLFGDVSWA